MIATSILPDAECHGGKLQNKQINRVNKWHKWSGNLWGYLVLEKKKHKAVAIDKTELEISPFGLTSR